MKIILENEFKNNLEKEFSRLEIENVNLIDKKDSKSDLTSLISCSEDYFEDLMKIYGVDEKVLEIDSNQHLTVNGSGILYLIINNDSSVFLDFKSESFESLFVKILVKKNINFELINQNMGEDLFTNIKIIQEENSKLKHIFFNVNNKQNINQTRLSLNAIYDLEGINYSQNEKLVNLNNAYHIGDNSNSDFKINCYSFDKSNIMCKTKTRIEKKTKIV